MKVLDLCCGRGHRFEGWFASEAGFLEQAERSAVACPFCGDTAARRMPSAPHLNIGSHDSQAKAERHRGEASRPGSSRAEPSGDEPLSEAGSAVTLQSQWLRAVRHIMDSSDDVGERFPEEARRIHYGETPERAIRGRATSDEAASLREEGIEVMGLPIPDALKGPVQ